MKILLAHIPDKLIADCALKSKSTAMARFTSKYERECMTRTCNLVTFKMHINSTLSQTKRKYCSFDVKNFYLNTPTERSEYMKILLAHIPDEIIADCALKSKVHSDGAIYIKI